MFGSIHTGNSTHSSTAQSSTVNLVESVYFRCVKRLQSAMQYTPTAFSRITGISMQGSCPPLQPGQKVDSVADRGVELVRSGQCVLRFSHELFFWSDGAAADDVWLDNLFLFFDTPKPADRFDNPEQSLSFNPELSPDAHLWLTNVTTFSGNAAGGVDVHNHVAYAEGASMHGCELVAFWQACECLVGLACCIERCSALCFTRIGAQRSRPVFVTQRVLNFWYCNWGPSHPPQI